MRPKERPVLLVDVDGVISLFGFDHTDPPLASPVVVDGIPHWLSEAAGRCLQRLSRTFECVWCTGWEERAEEHLPRLLGLPGRMALISDARERVEARGDRHKSWRESTHRVDR